jgi:hypothetical protein
MTVKKQILIILLIIGTAFAFSCKKNTEHDIIGTWERVIVEDSHADYTEDWIIDSDHIYIVQTKNGISDTTDQGTYIVKAGLTKKIIRTNGFGFVWFNNLDWKIEKLKGGQLIMFSDRDNYFLYYEFVKK